MAITKIQQLQISGTLASRVSDSISNANLLKANRTLEDDLNSLRTQVKLIIGGESWTSSLSGSQDLADIYTALRVTPSSGIAGFQSNVYVTGSISGSSNLSVGGNITTAGNIVADANTPRSIFTDVVDITIGGALSTLNVAGELKVTGNDISGSAGGNIRLGSSGDVFVAGDLTVAGNDIKSSTATSLTLSGADVTVAGDLTVAGNDIKASDGNTNITLASNTLTTFAGDIRVNGNDIQASDGNANITMTSNTLTAFAGDIKVGGNDIQASNGTVALTLDTSGNVTVAGDLQVSGNDIKSSNGSTAITLDGSNVIIPGDLTVNGSVVSINVSNLEIKDAVVGLGFASGTVQQSTGDRGWIGGIAGNNNVAFFWDDSATEFVTATTTNSATGSLPIPITSYSNFRAAQISGSVVKASLGLSGSLTQLTDGTSYLVAGSGILISSSSNGQVVISNNASAPVTIKGYLSGSDPNINTGTGVVAFNQFGTLASAVDEKIDVFLNGIFMAYGYDISTITTTSFTFDTSISTTLTSDDIISIVLRDTV